MVNQNGSSSNLLTLSGISPSPSPVPMVGGAMGGGLKKTASFLNRKRKYEEDVSTVYFHF